MQILKNVEKPNEKIKNFLATLFENFKEKFSKQKKQNDKDKIYKNELKNILKQSEMGTMIDEFFKSDVVKFGLGALSLDISIFYKKKKMKKVLVALCVLFSGLNLVTDETDYKNYDVNQYLNKGNHSSCTKLCAPVATNFNPYLQNCCWQRSYYRSSKGKIWS